MLPIDPNGIKAKWCDEPCRGNCAQSEVHARERGDPAFVGITDCFTGMAGLEERSCSVGCHALASGRSGGPRRCHCFDVLGGEADSNEEQE